MLRYIVLIPAIFLSIALNSQNLDWAYKLGGTYEDCCYDIAIDSSGNIYLTGGISNPVNMNLQGGSDILSAEGIDRSNIFVAVYNSEMDLKTAFVLKGDSWNDATDIEIDHDRNIYISGYQAGTIDFDPSEETFNLPGVNSHFFIAKYDSTGNFKWARNISQKKDIWGPVRSKLHSDRNSNLYLSTPDTLSKLDQYGNVLWAMQTNGFAAFDEKKSLYILSNSLTPWDDNCYASLNLLKIDTSGNILFEREIISNSTSHVNGFLSYDKSGNLLINGDYWGTTILGISNQITLSNERMEYYPSGPGGGLNESPSCNEYFAKFDTTGILRWAYDFGENNPNPYIIETSTDGTIYSLGFLNLSADFDHTEGLAQLTNSGYSNYIAKYDSSCNFIAATEFLGGSYNDFIGSFKLENDSGAYVCGKFMNFIDLDLTGDEFKLSSYINNSWSGKDIFIAKYSDFDIQDFTTSSSHSIYKDRGLNLYPNPSSDYINIENAVSVNRVSVQNISGQTRFILDEYNGNPIDISHLESGLYIFILELDEKIVTKKLIKE